MSAALRKVLFFLLMVGASISSWAQGIYVSSFKKLDLDLAARVNPVLDDNDETCALIKIVTTEKGFTIDCDGLDKCQPEDYSHVSEIYLYVPPGAKRVTISHPVFRQLREYEYPIPIESACTYEMILQTATPLYSKYNENYVIFNVLPADAEVRIDGKLVENKTGSVSQRHSVGRHTYTVSHPLYHPQKGSFEITPVDFTELNVCLKPDFGYLSVQTSPEQGAYIQINGEDRGKTPFFSDKMKSGNYSLRISHELYLPYEKTVSIKAEDTLALQVEVIPNYGYVSVFCEDELASIELDGKYMADGSWSGRLPVGEYVFAATRPSYHVVSQSVKVDTGTSLNLFLPSPTPLQGTICVTSASKGADVYMNTEWKGQAPIVIDNVFAGKYLLTLKSSRHPLHTQYVTLRDGDTVLIDTGYAKGKNVKIENIHPVAALYVDDAYIGAGDQKIKLSYGQHALCAKYLGKVFSDSVSVEKRGPAKFSINRGNDATLFKELEKDYKDSLRKSRPQHILFTFNGAWSPQMQWSFGLRFGKVRKWGWNVSLMTFVHFQAYTALSTVPYDLHTFDEKKGTRVSGTIGVLWHPTKHLLLFANGGYGFRGVAYHSSRTQEYYLYKPNTFHGFEGQLGLAGVFGGLVLSVEAATINFKYVELKMGLGFLSKIRK